MGLSDDELERRLRGDDSKIKEEQEVFRRIRDYIREHPGANAAEISKGDRYRSDCDFSID